MDLQSKSLVRGIHRRPASSYSATCSSASAGHSCKLHQVSTQDGTPPCYPLGLIADCWGFREVHSHADPPCAPSELTCWNCKLRILKVANCMKASCWRSITVESHATFTFWTSLVFCRMEAHTSEVIVAKLHRNEIVLREAAKVEFCGA